MTKELKHGDKAPFFGVPAEKYHGKKVVLFFYPKDNTPGCTKEACRFNELLTEFKSSNTEIYGISRDSLESHGKFTNKYGFLFELISDPDAKVCGDYGVYKQKSFLGKKFMGIERSTFVLDSKGNIAKIWRGVKVKGHGDEVLQFVKDLA